MVTNNAKIDYKMDYLIVRTVESTKRIHIREIGVLILESTSISITAYAICELIENKVKVIFCDHMRNPLAELIPMHGRYDSCAKVRQQIEWAENSKKSVWTEIVREKIYKQRQVLKCRGLPQEKILSSCLNQLKFNDSTNREGLAARVYFNALFGMEFTRASHCPTNAALNYGYSLILSAINREIAISGYLTQIGIFHNNTFNPYNLGCDFMEPLRPLVDDTVARMQPYKFEKEEKLMLVNLLNKEVVIDGKRQHLLYAIRLYCKSLFRALQSGDVGEIKLIGYEL